MDLQGIIVSNYDPSLKLEICMLVIYVNSQLNRRSGGESRELPPTTVWRQFPPFSPLLAVEPRVLSRKTAKYRFQ
jgi:hypothetical protein